MALAKDIHRLSEGQVVYDPRHRRLTLRDEGGHVAVDVAVTDAELRNGLQRLLLMTPHQGGREPQEAAVLILLGRLDVARAAATTRPAPVTLATLVG